MPRSASESVASSQLPVREGLSRSMAARSSPSDSASGGAISSPEDHLALGRASFGSEKAATADG
eukprot:12927017-Prorocentrum_lima.AAC.1